MRLIAMILTLVALGVAALAGQALWQELRMPDTAVAGQANPPSTEAQPPAPPKNARRWPALFGERQPPKPAAPPVQVSQEPQPPAPPRPPIESLGYTLKGVVRAGEATWAMIGHPTGDRLVRAGEELAPGIAVARIDSQGLWLSRDGADPELLSFPE